ncbi:unnamed protein product [Phyllotreta striolata]|uniref:Translation initiation factor eIF2B subunit alpha n=1 Tax=Phyllotreta striolata TaxID=444603 RepID=A0A9N9XVX6_PHYSR|nr:unnamed protein product [Phyllotreta striolata]
MTTSTNIQEYFCKIVKGDEDISVGVAAIRSLMEIIKYSKSETVQELEANLKEAIQAMKNTNFTVAAINSACELFIRFITLAALDTREFEKCKKIMLDRGHLFIKKLEEARGKIVKLSANFIEDGCVILTHSRSRVVLQTLRKASKQNKKFEVFVTISAPDNSGVQMTRDLEAEGIPCTLILDAAIGYIMERVNFIMVGAEGVVESGGIVNKVGSYTMAVCAKEMKKPFYVLTESFKFTRLFPLGQQDLPEEYKYTSDVRMNNNLTKMHPLVDYTPPSYITLLFTDLGILTPSAVSDELIKLYLCGGSLIHPQVAVTAAHCVNRKGPFNVRAGEWNWQIESEPIPHQDKTAKKVIIHPSFHPPSLRNDIAVLILKSPFKLTENIGLICLPARGVRFDMQGCVAAGWGKNSYKKGTYQSTLKKSLRDARLGPFFKLHRSFICAGGEANRDTCKGDGGSPLMCPIVGRPDKYHQVGIVSWGLTCGLQNTPGVYVNVEMFTKWIDYVLKSNGFDTTVYKSKNVGSL